FQAEDGIRDLTVTGVQTCALPILAWRVCVTAIWPSSETLPNAPRGSGQAPWKTPRWKIRSWSGPACSQLASQRPESAAVRERLEIGRASCRERVWGSGGGGGGERG